MGRVVFIISNHAGSAQIRGISAAKITNSSLMVCNDNLKERFATCMRVNLYIHEECWLLSSNSRILKKGKVLCVKRHVMYYKT